MVITTRFNSSKPNELRFPIPQRSQKEDPNKLGKITKPSIQPKNEIPYIFQIQPSTSKPSTRKHRSSAV